MNDTKSILIVGVGGQGTLLLSKLLGNVLINEGFDVKVSEVHGMSQRGGSVVTYVRYSDKVYSPLIREGEADFVLAFEQLEAARFITYLKQGGKLIYNRAKIEPMPVITGVCDYPDDIEEKINANVDSIALDASALAKQAGSVKAVNVVLLGVFAKYTNIPKEKFIEEIKRSVPPKFVDLNCKAFNLGYEEA
ncbi:MAG: indolepyruvate oxidoreductase subunit beta [Clostridia bacterium]|nr:indolepyruvate oxidoreductase subunit beta [Clostridia bacterium]